MITVLNKPAKRVDTTLNDIPAGTAFWGQVLTESGTWVTGLFWMVRKTPARLLYCVELTDPTTTENAYHSLVGSQRVWMSCKPVRDYQPVDLVITVKDK